jgi:hypothetical protein
VRQAHSAQGDANGNSRIGEIHRPVAGRIATPRPGRRYNRDLPPTPAG